jgi:hypothetical protein
MGSIIYSVEDDLDIARIINKTLTKQGYQVYSFQDGKSFIEAFNKQKPDLVLLDLMLPDMNGNDIIKFIRNDIENNEVEIIIISAKRMLMDKVEGLDLGADDYLEKPFDLLELMSRVNARLRRHQNKNILIYNNLKVDLQKHLVFLDNKEIICTNKEFDILTYLLQRKGQAVSRDDLLTFLWGDNNSDYESRTIDVHIKSLRAKLNDNDGSIIQTIYGIGYKIGI